jgi:hypothetical protein
MQVEQWTIMGENTRSQLIKSYAAKFRADQAHDTSDAGLMKTFANCVLPPKPFMLPAIREEIETSAAAATLGRKGGSSKSLAKQVASRTNGKLGGRHKK